MRLCFWAIVFMGTVGMRNQIYVPGAPSVAHASSFTAASEPRPPAGGLRETPQNHTSTITVSTKDSLRLAEGTYSSILFTATPSTRMRMPVQYSFVESGFAPSGMIFESYPCNKPGQSICPQLARSDGIYLDGVPSSPGSFEVTITAADPDGNKASRRFSIVVKARRPNQ